MSRAVAGGVVSGESDSVAGPRHAFAFDARATTSRMRDLGNLGGAFSFADRTTRYGGKGADTCTNTGLVERAARPSPGHRQHQIPGWTSSQGVRRLRRPALKGQDCGVNHTAVPDLDRAAQGFVGVPGGGAFEHRTKEGD